MTLRSGCPDGEDAFLIRRRHCPQVPEGRRVICGECLGLRGQPLLDLGQLVPQRGDLRALRRRHDSPP